MGEAGRGAFASACHKDARVRADYKDGRQITKMESRLQRWKAGCKDGKQIANTRHIFLQGILEMQSIFS